MDNNVWSVIGAVSGLLALFEAPILVGLGAAWRWSRRIEARLEAIESRGRQVRRGDYRG